MKKYRIIDGRKYFWVHTASSKREAIKIANEYRKQTVPHSKGALARIIKLKTGYGIYIRGTRKRLL